MCGRALRLAVGGGDGRPDDEYVGPLGPHETPRAPAGSEPGRPPREAEPGLGGALAPRGDEGACGGLDEKRLSPVTLREPRLLPRGEATSLRASCTVSCEGEGGADESGGWYCIRARKLSVISASSDESFVIDCESREVSALIAALAAASEATDALRASLSSSTFKP